MAVGPSTVELIPIAITKSWNRITYETTKPLQDMITLVSDVPASGWLHTPVHVSRGPGSTNAECMCVCVCVCVCVCGKELLTGSITQRVSGLLIQKK